jgi:hypothetical protein
MRPNAPFLLLGESNGLRMIASRRQISFMMVLIDSIEGLGGRAKWQEQQQRVNLVKGCPQTRSRPFLTSVSIG